MRNAHGMYHLSILGVIINALLTTTIITILIHNHHGTIERCWQVHLIPSINPDGNEACSRHNANDEDLNRFLLLHPVNGTLPFFRLNL